MAISEGEGIGEGGTGLALVASLGRILNRGQPPEPTLRDTAVVLQQWLGVASVSIWRREANAVSFFAVSSPPGDKAAVGLDDLPPATQGTVRLPLSQGGIRLGLLEVEAIPGRPPIPLSVLQVLADILTPYLDAMTLSEDLAYEVASRSREIDEQRRFTGLIIDSLPVGLYVIDRDYRIQIWNRKRETGTQGLRRDEVVGRPVFEVLTHQPAGQLRADFDRIFRTGQLQQMDIETGAGGDRRFYRTTKIPMRLDGGEITHIITIGEDVTDSHKIQQQILQSEKLAAIGQLAAGVMHEINNPLATIGACVAAIEGRVGASAGPQVEEYLRVIEREVERCTRIVDGLLDFSRPKSSVRQKVEADLNTLIEETLFLLKHHQRFRRLAVNRELSVGLPPVLADSEQIIQVMMALMLNAVDALEQGGSLTVRTRANPLRRDEIVAEVEDTGIGMAHSELTKIFEPFYTTKPPGRGTGLGLSICYGIMQEHGGRIEADSEPGRGSVFRVYFPIQRDRTG
ncbi:MAG: ATP-binding protein [Gemmatimonadota bacterium]|nr:ATP-binding protein [Gemmatimonadota bacterium]